MTTPARQNRAVRGPRRVIGKTTTRARDRISSARNRKGRQGMKMQGEVHSGKTITDLSELVERAEAKAGCYASSSRSSEASADDPVVEESFHHRGTQRITEKAGEPIPERAFGELIDPLCSSVSSVVEDSCGVDAAAGKASDGACVEGLGEWHGSGCQQGQDGDGSAMSSRSESQQNCAGLG